MYMALLYRVDKDQLVKTSPLHLPHVQHGCYCSFNVCALLMLQVLNCCVLSI